MDAISFVAKYPEYIETIRQVTRMECLPALKRLEDKDPHDVIKPETWFPDDNAALGFVYRLFLNEVRKDILKKIIESSE